MREDRPDHLSSRAMFDPRMFRCGKTKVPSTLKPEVMASFHRTICADCRAHGLVSPTCYFHKMLDCIIYGWMPPIDLDNIKPRDNLRNSRKAELYHVQVMKEFATMVEHKAVELVPDQSSIRAINPLGAVIKNSDIQRARSLAHINVVDSDSLQRASDTLISMGQPKIKCRISTDCTGAGLNGASYVPPFTYSSIGDGVSLLTRNDFLAKGDISRYFYSFPFANEVKPYFSFVSTAECGGSTRYASDMRAVLTIAAHGAQSSIAGLRRRESTQRSWLTIIWWPWLPLPSLRRPWTPSLLY